MIFWASIASFWSLPFLLLASSCTVSGPQEDTSAPFSLDYHVHKGLDCAALQDCGFRVEVQEAGALVRYADIGTGELVETARRQLTPQERNALHETLDETGFFAFPAVIPVNNPRAGAGSVSVVYQAGPEQTSKTVMIMKNGPLPEEAQQFMTVIEAFFEALLD